MLIIISSAAAVSSGDGDVGQVLCNATIDDHQEIQIYVAIFSKSGR
jgi:hypothetical protein